MRMQSKRRFSKSKGQRRVGRGDRMMGRTMRRKVCRFCSDKAPIIDYKDTEMLTRFLTEKGKIIPRRVTGNCAKHQRRLAATVKRSRHSGLLAFVSE